MYIHVPVLILFFNITIYGPKHHILACVQPAWEQIEATFGSKFWPVYLANSGLRSKITVLIRVPYYSAAAMMALVAATVARRGGYISSTFQDSTSRQH